MKSLKIAALAAALIFPGFAAIADGNQTTPGGAVVNEVVQDCINASGKAVPCSNISSGLVTSGPTNVTLTDCSGTITTGGTAQNAIAASSAIHGFVIANIDAASGSGEPVWMSLTGTATAATAQSYPLPPPAVTTFAGNSSFTSPSGMATNHAVSVVAATTGHKFSCTYW